MSLQLRAIPDVPEETRRVAQRAFPNGNRWLALRDEFGTIYSDQDLADLFPRKGQPAAAAWRLALILVMQFAEGLSDEQAETALRSRIDWKYALSLPLADPGLDASVLSEFRTRLVAGGAEQRLLDQLLGLCQERALLKQRGRQRTDATPLWPPLANSTGWRMSAKQGAMLSMRWPRSRPNGCGRRLIMQQTILTDCRCARRF